MKALLVAALVTLANLASATSFIIPGGGSGNASSLRDDIASCTGGTFLKRNAGDTAWECGGSASAATDTVFAAKGDLLVGTANDTAAILTVGANTLILSADSTEATGLKWIAAPGGGDALTASTIQQFAPITSANLLGEITDETGTGVAVFSTAPTLVTPVLGVATATSINGNTIATAADAVVLRTATQTLTGKTLTAADNVNEADTVVSYANMGGDLSCIGLTCLISSDAIGGDQLTFTNELGGDIIFYNSGASTWEVLHKGSVGQVLTINPGGTLPEWSNATASGDNVLVDSTNTTNPDFVSTGDIDFVNTASTITANVQQNTVALGTDTTGGYAASSAEGGAATTATALAANGADCSAGNAPLGVDASGAAASCFDVVTQTEGDLKAPLTSPVFLTSIALPQGASPTVDAAGEIAHDTTGDQLLFGATPRVLTYVETECAAIENTSAATDDRDVWMPPHGVTITSVGCSCEGTCTGTATFTLEDRSGNAMTITGTNPTCSTSGASTYAAVTAGNSLIAGEKLAFDVTNTPNPETDEYLLCWTYTVDRL